MNPIRDSKRLRWLGWLLLAAGQPGLATGSGPDLIADARDLEESLSVTRESFSLEDCVFLEGCVRAPGERRLLRLDTRTINIGDQDLVVGAPENNAAYEFSACHGHYHFRSYASFELLHARTGEPVRVEGDEVVAYKQGFCLYDDEPFASDRPPRYTCDFQGISAGWSDFYSRDLDCQWVDITGVIAGDYILRITVNPFGTLPETRLDNNSVEVPVKLS